MKNFSRFKNQHGQVWLNVASSSSLLEGFINLDNHIVLYFLSIYPFIKWAVPGKYKVFFEQYIQAKKQGLMVTHDCRKALPFADSSVDHILCSHFLEHVYPDELTMILGEFRRALKKEATLHIIIPDLGFQIKRYVENKKLNLPQAADELIKETLLCRQSRGSVKYRLLEFIGSFGLQHRWMYDYSSMAMRIKEAGFEILDANETPSKDYRHNDYSVHIVACKR
jgi:predicted SAM-dependent methyltransferase